MKLQSISINTPACHASTLAECSDKSVIVAWLGGSAEGKNDVAIWLTRITNRKIATPVAVAKISNLPHWNPVLHVNNNNVTLFFKVGRTVTHWKSWVMRSSDSGHTWSVPCELVPGDAGGRGPVKNKCIILADGTLLAPASHENGRWRPFADASRDNGINWKRSDYIHIQRKLIGSDNGKNLWLGAIQPTLWESQPGHVHMLLRSNGGVIMRSDSCDGGISWCRAYETSLPSNNSGIDLVRLDDGTLILLCNPTAGNWAVRTPLSMLISKDNGCNWKLVMNLADSAGDEYSYPAIIPMRDGGIAFSFTWRRQKIAFGKITGAELFKINNDKIT